MLTTGEMLEYTNRLNGIMSAPATHSRDMRLANMMTDLEVAYRIPALKNEEFEKQNPHIMQLYRTVSEDRS